MKSRSQKDSMHVQTAHSQVSESEMLSVWAARTLLSRLSKKKAAGQ